MSEKLRDWQDKVPLALVAIAVIFNLAALRKETVPVSMGNDGPQHLLMIRWAQERIRSGHLPFDGWYPYLGFGSPHFHHYQSFPHIVGGLFATIFGAPRVYTWSLYLLLSLWPICVYWSGRLFGASRWVSGVAALVSLLVASTKPNAIGFEYEAYIRGGFGVWAQLWGMWLLPLALALSWRAVNGEGSFLWPALALALLLASHFLTGYLALLVIGVWVFVSTRDVLRRMWRSAVIVVGAFGVGAWALAPPILDARWASRLEWLLHTFYTDSYGPRRVLGWLVTGKVFDSGRFPVITLFVALGVGVCIAHWEDLRARALLYLGGLSLLLYMGRTIVGPVLDRLPIGGDILLHRYVMSVHLAGIFLAGVGAVWLGGHGVERTTQWLSDTPARGSGRKVRARRRNEVASRELVVASVLVVGFGLLLLVPAWKERWTFAARSAAAIQRQHVADATDGRDVGALIEQANGYGDGRVYAGVSTKLGEIYRVGGVQVYRILADHEADGVGYIERTLSLPSNVERLFNEVNPANFELFNVRYAVLNRPPFISAHQKVTVLARRGLHTLWRIDTSGYLDVVDTQGSIRAGRGDLGHRMSGFMASDLPAKKLYPTVAFEGARPAPTTLLGSQPSTPPGTVTKQFAHLMDGDFGGAAVANRRAVVLLKSSFDPRWRITVDGKRVVPEMIAPGFVGAVVDPGPHTVRFAYSPLPWYGALFAIAVLAGLGLALLRRFVPALTAVSA